MTAATFPGRIVGELTARHPDPLAAWNAALREAVPGPFRMCSCGFEPCLLPECPKCNSTHCRCSLED